jgi:hypothetical protein
MSEIDTLRADNERLYTGLTTIRNLMEQAIKDLDDAADIQAKMVTALIAAKPWVAECGPASQLVAEALAAVGMK